MQKIISYLLVGFLFFLSVDLTAAIAEDGQPAMAEPAAVAQKVDDKAAAPKRFTEPITGMEFVWLPGGCFQMGQTTLERKLLIKEVGKDEFSKYYSDELPRHEVCLDGFWIGKYEVTQGQWGKVMEDNPAYFKKGDDYPMDTVSWEEAQRFLANLNNQTKSQQFRLPTEAEWEYAARGGTDTIYHFGNEISTTQANYNGLYIFGYGKKEGYRKGPLAVGSLTANAFGLYDMHGNVWEWCNDWYVSDYYKVSPVKSPMGPTEGQMRVLRGGSWFHYSGNIRSATRYKNDPVGQYGDTGFRVVRTTGTSVISPAAKPAFDENF